MTSDKLLDKIRKLHAMAQSAAHVGNDAEAQAFAAKVQALLVEHKLSLSDLDMELVEKQDPMGTDYVRSNEGKRAQTAWIVNLAGIVARAHFSRILLAKGSDYIVFVGRESDRKIAAFVFETLRRFADQRSDKEARAFRRNLRKQVGATYGANKDFRAAWLDGFNRRIAERYRDEERERERAAKVAGTALIRLDQADTQVQAYVDQIAGKGYVNVRGRASANQAGREAGYRAGNEAAIRGTGLGSGATSSVRGHLR
jgi:hypothetical protein